MATTYRAEITNDGTLTIEDHGTWQLRSYAGRPDLVHANEIVVEQGLALDYAWFDGIRDVAHTASLVPAGARTGVWD